jgi:hypothetical protein
LRARNINTSWNQAISNLEETEEHAWQINGCPTCSQICKRNRTEYIWNIYRSNFSGLFCWQRQGKIGSMEIQHFSHGFPLILRSQLERNRKLGLDEKQFIGCAMHSIKRRSNSCSIAKISRAPSLNKEKVRHDPQRKEGERPGVVTNSQIAWEFQWFCSGSCFDKDSSLGRTPSYRLKLIDHLLNLIGFGHFLISSYGGLRMKISLLLRYQRW